MMTAETLLDQWLDDLRPDRAPRTIYRYRGAVRHFLVWFHEQEQRTLELRDLMPITLVGYRTYLQRAAAASTVNTHVSALRAWCAWLTEHGQLPTNPAARFKFVDHQRSTGPSGLTANQVNALLRAAQRSRHPVRDTAIMHMLVQTGMRLGECAGLLWADLTIREKSGQVRIRAGKGNKARTIPLNASARDALAQYLAPVLGCAPTLRAVAACWSRSGLHVPQAPVWHSQKGGQLSASAIGRVIEGLVRDRAARGLVPASTSAHTLRHTFAQRYLAAHPSDLVGLAALLGHSSLETTRIYVQPTMGQLANRIEHIDLNAYSD